MKNRLFAAVCASTFLGTALSARAAAVDFNKQVQPILEQSCIRCHGAEKQKGKLRLDSKEAALKGGADGPSVVPGDAEKSELYLRITLPKDSDDRMPNEGDPLSKAQTDLILEWIKEGANWPAGLVLANKSAPTQAGDGPRLPDDFKPGAAEQTALKKLADSGISLHPVAMNLPWREANLRLRGAEVSDATVAGLKDVKSLVDLNLSTTKITDAALVHLKGMAHLQKLNLSQTAITDAGLSNLRGLTNLTYLNLYGTALSDAGLEPLHKLPHLRKLYVWQTKVTDDGIAKLKAALPKVEVVKGFQGGTPPKEAVAAEVKKEEAK